MTAHRDALFPAGAVRYAVLLFVVALLIRLAFWRATPDALWSYSLWYKGDAPLWVEATRVLTAGETFQFGLPLRPPGMLFLLPRVLSLVGGPGAAVGLWCALGALVPTLFFLAAVPSVGVGTARLAGAIMAVSSGLLMLSTSLNNETPYLVLVGLGFLVFEVLRRGRLGASPAMFWWLVVWGVLQAAATLVRVEHLLFALPCAWLLLRRNPAGVAPPPRTGRLLPALLVTLGFLAVLAPWQVSAWRAVDRFNRELPVASPRMGGPSPLQLQRMMEALPWDPGAAAILEELPGFGRPFWGAFVTATVAHRGGVRVRPADLRILEEAFGDMPRPLSRRFLVANYGPVNAFLAQNDRAVTGFTRAGLGIPPPLAGGPDRYPGPLVAGLPPPDQLSFLYPPHLEVMTQGYVLAGRWMAAHPDRFVRRVWARLGRFWQGAAHGLTGYAFPVGLSGVRPRVDLVIPDPTPRAWLWQGLVLLACLVGFLTAPAKPALAPWILFAATKGAIVVVFFGYARMGATVVPVIALLASLALTRALAGVPPRWRWGRVPGLTALTGVVLLGGLILESVRLCAPPRVSVDAAPVDSVDPFPEGNYQDRRIEVAR